MGPRSRLTAALLAAAISSCGPRNDAVAVPPFAGALPGRTALVLWGAPEHGSDGELRELLAPLAAALGLQPVDAPGAFAWRCDDEIAVGWDSLAASHSFRSALAAVPLAEQRLYVDLELLLESVTRHWPSGLAAVQARLRNALGLRSLQFAIAGIEHRDGDLIARGTIGTSGARAGLPGLLTAPLDGATFAPVLDPRSSLQLEVFCDPEVAQRALEALTSPGERGALLGDPFAGPARAFDQFVEQLSGRVSLTVHGISGLRIAAGVRDEAKVRAAAEHLLELAPPDGVFAPKLEVAGGWAVLRLPGSTAWTPPDDTSTAGPFAWATLRLPPATDPDQRRLTVWLRRAADDRIAVELTLGS